MLIVGALASCGSSGAPSSGRSSSGGAGLATLPAHSSPAPGSKDQPLKLAAAANGRLAFMPKTLKSTPGKVVIDFTNESPLQHNLTIASRNGAVLGATATFQGGTRVLAIKLKQGLYTYYCSVPGHRAAGMQGTLIVR